MTRVLFSGDHHFDESSRFDECKRIHAWMVDVARENHVDLFLSGGDIYEHLSSIREREAVADWLTAMAEVCPVVAVKGNHDRTADARLMSRLESRHPIIVEEAASVHTVAGVAVAAVAWPNKASLAAATHGMAGEQLDAVAREAYRAILMGLRPELAAHDGPKVLVGHWMVDGSKTSHGQPLIGGELNIGLADLVLPGADIVLCSHIHMPQEWQHDGTDVVMAGSPRRTAYGELETKSVVLVEWGNGQMSWRRIPTPCTPMILIDAAFDDTLAWTEQDVTGAEVRLRINVPADQREAARHAANELREELLRRGAVMVKVEEQVDASVRARAPEVATATTLEDKLRAYWKAKGIDLGDREPRVLGRLGEVTT
jgi:DNA repair exonuclease SbcCD nuclease subunit